MTPQEIFNMVWNHFIRDEAPLSGTYDEVVVDEDNDEYSDGITCLYRGPGGERCAVGLLIPDELYEPGMEGLSVSKVADALPLDVGNPLAAEVRRILEQNVLLLRDLQLAHDRTFRGLMNGSLLEAGRTAFLTSGLKIAAAKHGLEVPA